MFTAIDRYGVVWFENDGICGMMSSACYESMRRKDPKMTPLDELPFFDNRNQNVVDVSDDEDDTED